MASPPRRRLTISLRGSALPSLSSAPPSTPSPQPNPHVASLEAAVEALLPDPRPPTLPPLQTLTASIFRVAQHPDPLARLARLLAFHSIHPPRSALEVLWAAVRLVEPRPSSHATIYPNREWQDHAAAVFEAAAVASGLARAHPLKIASDPEPNPKTIAPEPVASSSSAQQEDPSWLRLRCACLAVVSSGDGLSAAEMAASVLTLLTDMKRTDEHLQGDLFDAFLGDFDAVHDVLQRRAQLVSSADAILSDCAAAASIAQPSSSGTRRQPRGVSSRRRGRKQNGSREEELDEPSITPNLGGSAFAERERFFPGMQLQTESVIGSVDRIGLPAGSTRDVGRGYEEIFVPPPRQPPTEGQTIVTVRDSLREHPELLQAMQGVERFNRLQSAVFRVAFHTEENLLVCAPTGAGKTNVALLTVFREIVAVKTRMQRSFKVVYVAPMKALAAEVTEKFGKRLASLGLRVREFTGDMSLSRMEAMETHVLVTTPEKWDVVTRKSGSELGDAVTLFIVDEVHLLHDERGAVLESIVARTLRLSETAQKQIRLVGLSATLPNYRDVGSFMRVNPDKGLFHFDSSHRPVPLSQTFIGISEGGTSNSPDARYRRDAKMREMAWKKVKDSLQRGHQAMIFVHSRKGTITAAMAMLQAASSDGLKDFFLGGDRKQETGGEEDESSFVMPSWANKEISKSKSAEFKLLCLSGIGIHNAGMQRSDRKLVEKLFAEGILRLLCCTATLAWGINLPARTVVIMGTELYNAQKGGFVQLGMLDVMQIFGRAGRPQFDTEGEGTIITLHENLGKYLNLLTSSHPIESQLGSSASLLADHLNAEIVSGTVSSVGEGVRWLRYTYLSVRMPQNHQFYGIKWDDLQADPDLHTHRANLIQYASKALDDARMCRYDPTTGALAATDLGRVSSHFYVSHQTMVLWNELLGDMSLEPAVTDEDWMEVYGTVIHVVSCATEFEQMRVRQDEMEELDGLSEKYCEIPLKSGPETRQGKVAILLQSYISRATVRMSDLSYVIESSTRLLRALFEVAIRRGLPSLSLASLELARASESRIWPFAHPLWQFSYAKQKVRGLVVQREVIAAIEEKGSQATIAELRKMTKDELSVIIRAPRMALAVQRAAHAIPTLDIVSATVAPLSRTVLLVEVKLFPNFRWNEAAHGNAESWWIWVEDNDEYRVYHSQRILLTKNEVKSLNHDQPQRSPRRSQDTLDYTFFVPVFDPPSSHYWVRVESEHWHTGGGSTAPLSLADMKLPYEKQYLTDLLDLRPLPVRSSLPAEEALLFEDLSHFTPLQTQAFHAARHTEQNMLVAAPLGSGKSAVADFALLRALCQRRDACVVCIASNPAKLLEKQKRWQKVNHLASGGIQMLDSRFVQGNENSLLHAGIILCSPEQWLHFSREWDDQLISGGISLFILDEIDSLLTLEKTCFEVAISRLLLLQTERQAHGKVKPRIVGLSSIIPNAAALGDWLGVDGNEGLFCFDQRVRQVPCEPHVVGVAGDRYTSRMHAVNHTLFSMIQRYSAKKPTLIYVSSRRQCLLTAQDLLRLAGVDGKKDAFSSETAQVDETVTRVLRDVSDRTVAKYLSGGIGLFHESMSERVRAAVALLYTTGYIQVVIATFAMANRAALPSHLVVVKGTETYRPILRRYEDVSVAELLNMTGQAGRPEIDRLCHSIVFVHEPKKTLFRKFLHEPLPIESSLHKNLVKAVLLEMTAGRVKTFKDGIDLMARSFLFQRLNTNPGYYGLTKKSNGRTGIRNGGDAVTDVRLKWASDQIAQAFKSLFDAGCMVLSENGIAKVTVQGTVSAAYNLPISFVRGMKDGLASCEKLEDVFSLVFSSRQISLSAPSGEEEKSWAGLSKLICTRFCTAGLFGSEETAAKALGLIRCFESEEKRRRAACYCLITETKLQTPRLDMDLRTIQDIVVNSVAAAFDLAVQIGRLKPVRMLTTVSQALYQGILPTEDFWIMSGSSTEGISSKGRQEGYTSISDVLKDEPAFLQFLALKCDHEGLRRRLANWLAIYPRISISVRWGKRAVRTLLISLNVRRRKAAGRGGVDTFSSVTQKRTGGFIILVGSAQKDRIFGSRRVADVSVEQKTISVPIDNLTCEPDEALHVWVTSDVHMGVNVSMQVSVDKV